MPPRIKKEHPLPGFGAKLRKARLEKGLMQTEVARELGVRKLTVSMWERDKMFPGDGNLVAVCEFLGLEPPLPDRNETGRRSTGQRNCEYCGKEFPVFYGEQFCSKTCANRSLSERFRGEGAPNWKGGKRRMDAKGYVSVRVPGHPDGDKNGYVREHRYVMEQVIGRPLFPAERVHHKNGIRNDNRPENLELWSGGRKDPPGQRVEDLVRFVCENYPEEVRRHMS